MHGEIAEVVVFPPNCGGAVVEHCGNYTVGYGAWRGSRPGRRPWPCGDRVGVLTAPAGGVMVPVESTVPCVRCGGAPRVLQVGVLPCEGCDIEAEPEDGEWWTHLEDG